MNRGAFVGWIIASTILIVALFSWRIAEPAHTVETSPQGHYQLITSTISMKATFLVDTGTGHIWQWITFTDIKGEPGVWELMPRFDSKAQESEWLSHQSPKSSEAPPTEAPQAPPTQ